MPVPRQPGSDGNTAKISLLRGALYGAGYHVLTLPSPTCQTRLASRALHSSAVEKPSGSGLSDALFTVEWVPAPDPGGEAGAVAA